MMTLTPDKLKLDGYVRDLQRSYSKGIISGEWQKNLDGAMEITMTGR